MVGTWLLLAATALTVASISSSQAQKTMPEPARASGATAATLIGAMQQELDRSSAALSKADPPAYFLGYTVTDSQRAEVQGSNGALLSSQEQRSRWLEVQVRVGNYDLDNTRKVGDRQGFRPATPGSPVPVGASVLGIV